MHSTLLSRGWTVSPKRGPFEALDGSGAAPEAVTLPHDAMLGSARSAEGATGVHGGYFPDGAVEYTRALEIDPADVDRVHTLVFDGVYRDAMVYVNDHYAAQRPYGYSRFAVRLDPYLHGDKPNVIRVEARAHRDSRWYSGLGIHRDVTLATSALVHIALDGVRVSTPEIDDLGALVQVETTVTNDSLHTRTVTAHTRIVAPDASVIARGRTPLTLLAGESGIARARLWVEKPQRWSIDAPTLYRAEVTTNAGEMEDADAVSFGIRSLQLDPRHGLRINGESVKLRGACIHHDNGILGARAIRHAEHRRIRLLKEAGFNAIRSAHNPLSPAMLDACDRIGMVVMDEAFDMWVEGKSPFDYSLAFPQWWERDVDAMVAKDFNHPSVVFYSIGNEILETGRTHGSRIGRVIAERVRALDPTRFTTNSINGALSVMKEAPPFGGGESADATAGLNDAMADMGTMMTEMMTSDLVSERTEESFAAVDAAGVNYGDSRYASERELFPNRVLIGSETFVTRIDLAWPLVLANDHVVGDFTWTGWDYLGEAGIGRVDYVEPGGHFGGTAGAYPWQLAWCGDIDITGNRRPASFYREIVFGLRDRPYIAVQRPRTDGLVAAGGPWSWSDSIASWTWDVETGTEMAVEVYSDADEVELLLDGASIGRAPAGRENRHRVVFNVPYAPGELVAVAYTGGTETGRTSLRCAAGEIMLRADAEDPQIGASTQDLAYVSISLVDADGVVSTVSDREVEVTVSGAGTLLGLGSARPDTTESYLGTRTTTFDGLAQAIVQPTGEGDITITVSADGCHPQTLTVHASAAP